MEKHQGYEPEGVIAVEISTAVVLVLDHMLDRWTASDDDASVRIENDAEWHSLSILAWTIEKELSQTGLLSSSSRYDELL